MSDLISRQALINKAEYEAEAMAEPFKSQLPVLVAWLAEKIPSEEPEPAIPLSWIEGQIKWLKSLDNAFSTLTAVQISAMVNKWRGEQDGTEK